METKRREVVVTRLHRAVVRALAPASEAAGIVHDLQEEAAQIGVSQGARAARRWTRWQVAHSVAPWIGRRVRESGAGARSAVSQLHRGLWSDIRLAARRLAKSPTFTILACLTLAVGIAAVSTVFSLAYALWLKPLPYLDPDRLVWIQARHEPSGTTGSLTTEEFAAHRLESRSLAGVAGFSYGANIARFDAEPVRVLADPVSPNLFRVLGVRPARGRDFADSDANPGLHMVMLSHATWVRRFGRDPGVVGKMLTMDNESFEIVGVMPQGFTFPRGALEADVWVPATFSHQEYQQGRFLQAVARLAPDRTLADAAAEANVRVQALTPAASGTNSRWTALVTPAGATATHASQLAFQALLGIVGLFLVMACINLAGQLLARNSVRRAELALRLSIGGSRWRLARMLLVESTMLAAIGCAAGVLLASYASGALAALMPPRTAGLADVGVNTQVVAVAVVISLLSALLVGLAPALSLRSLKPSAALLGLRTTANLARGQRAIVVVEVALAVVLVVGASVMLRTFLGLLDQDRGYDPRGLLALNVSLPFSDDSFLPVDKRARAFGDMLDRAAAVPGVRRAAATTGFPGSPLGILGSAPFTPPDGRAQVIAAIHAASAGYFETMGIPIKAGRSFAATDSTHGPLVAIVNEQLAREFPSGNPLGYRIPLSLQGAIAGKDASYEIVGVVGNIRLSGQAGYRVFVPITQASPYWIDLLVRADNPSVLPAVRQALRNLNPDLLLENESSFQTIISNSLALERAQSGFAGLIGVLSVLVSGGGLYALVALMVAQRRRELGIRLALGSTPRQLFRDTLWRGLRMVAAGIALGEIASLVLVRLLGSRVFGLGSADAAGYAGAAALILFVALAAVSIPARQVIGTDPLVALRSD